MTTCPTCGAKNDPANRFCDQCGTRLASEAAPAPIAGGVAPDQPTVAAPVCPTCGSTVLPGEAFCDNCGADLTALTAAPAVAAPAPTLPAADAPTMMATPPAPSPEAPTPAAGSEVTCPICGSPAMPGERFCDNCGADLTVPAPKFDETPAAPTEAAPTEAPIVSPDDATMLVPPSSAADTASSEASPEASPAQSVPADEAAPDDATMIAPIAEAAPQSTPMVPVPPPAPADAEPAPGAAPGTPAADPSTTQPASAEAAPASTGDNSAERQRLEELVAAHRDTVAQYEQMASRYPAGSAPAFITAGLDAARAELTKAEADLAALIGGAPAPAALAAPAVAEAAPALAAPETAPPVAAPPISMPAPEPPPAPAPAGPRLVLADGQEIKLPTDRAEIIVGREDPVSNIFPEVDLTPHGGEAGGVSRQHAKITTSGGQWMITDLNSTNYTRVNGDRLEPNVATPLPDGAKVQFGRVAATFHL